MNIVDEYMLQRFPQVKGPNKGKLETDTQYKARICWYRNGYPTFKEVESLCGTKEGTIQNYSDLFDWKGIKQHATDLEVRQEQIDLRQRQKDVEESHRRRNQKLGKANEDYLDELLDKLTSDELTDYERDAVIKEIRETRRELSSIQRDERTTEHLPNSYKDISGDFNVDGNMNVNADVLAKLERPLPELDKEE